MVLDDVGWITDTTYAASILFRITIVLLTACKMLFYKHVLCCSFDFCLESVIFTFCFILCFIQLER